MKPMINKYDVTISPDNNLLIQKTIEVDAIDMETACDFLRSAFNHSIRIVDITAHRDRKTVQKMNPVIAFFSRIKYTNCVKLHR